MLHFIVGRLKEKPFNLSIRAVDFDDKHPGELLQVLNDVLASLNAELKADFRTATKDEVVEHMRHFLIKHGCMCVPNLNDEFSNKGTINQMLYWVLSNYESLQKEEYLAHYLSPVEVPSEYMFMQTNENLRELFDAYKELQVEFIDVQKKFTVANADRPTTGIFENIDQLEVEKRQLHDRLQREQAQISNNVGLQRLIVQASEMRQAQDDELRLERQREEQVLSLTFTKQRLKQANRMLKLIESCGGKTIEIIVNELSQEYQHAVHNLEANTIPERQNAELMMVQASKKKDHPNKVKVEVDCAINDDTTNDLQNRKQMELDNLRDQVGKSDKLMMLKKELNDVTSKACSLRDAIDSKMLLKELIESKNDELGNFIKALDGTGKSVSKSDLADLQESVNKNREFSDKLKLEIAAIQASVLELQKTENYIKHRQHELLSHQQKKDRIAGVAKFNDISDKLVATSKDTATLNTMKEKTLADISTMVQDIAKTLEVKQHELKPKIEELKIRRKQFQDLQKVHDNNMATYREMLTALTNENRELENDCSRLRQEWLEKASSPHLPSLKDKVTLIHICHLEFEKERRAQQQRRSNEQISNQKDMFVKLKKLLDLKSKTMTGEILSKQ